MKNLFLFFLLSLPVFGISQDLILKKGIIIDDVMVNDTLTETFAVYLPTTFEMTKKWPVVFVYDMQGRGKQALSMFREAAEDQGYILAASNNVNDSLPLSKNILVSNRMFNAIYNLLPIQIDRTYTAGISSGARVASLIPMFIKQIKGVIGCGAPVANAEVLSSKTPFHFIGIVGVEDFNYTPMLNAQIILNKLKFPNTLLVFDGGAEWPPASYIAKAMELFTLSAMAKGVVLKQEDVIRGSYKKNLGEVSALISSNKLLQANKLLTEMMAIYRPHMNVDSLRESSKTLRKGSLFRSQSRSENAALFKEWLIKEDYSYYLEEDVLTYNYNNLGWWKYQMEELQKYQKSKDIFEQQMSKRLKGYVNALIADNVDLVKMDSPVDEEALNFLWMVNTVTDPTSYDPYLKIIAFNSKVEDYGTALFYLEELLKNGYTDQEALYSIDHTALLRISPEFNEIVAKYLKEARYDVIDE